MRFESKYCCLSFWNNWIEIFCVSKFNWVNFTVIIFEFEYDKHGPTLESTIGLLGFCMRFSAYPGWTTKQSEELKARVNKLKGQTK